MRHVDLQTTINSEYASLRHLTPYLFFLPGGLVVWIITEADPHVISKAFDVLRWNSSLNSHPTFLDEMLLHLWRERFKLFDRHCFEVAVEYRLQKRPHMSTALIIRCLE